MTDPKIIREIAEERLAEAIILRDKGKYNGAFYLAGYAVELALKAKICDNFGFPNLFDEDDQSAITGIGELRKAVKKHDLFVLLMFSGLKIKFDDAMANDKGFLRINSLLFKNWNESYRYKPCGFCKDYDVIEMIDLMTNANNIMQWINRS